MSPRLGRMFLFQEFFMCTDMIHPQHFENLSVPYTRKRPSSSAVLPWQLLASCVWGWNPAPHLFHFPIPSFLPWTIVTDSENEAGTAASCFISFSPFSFKKRFWMFSCKSFLLAVAPPTFTDLPGSYWWYWINKNCKLIWDPVQERVSWMRESP